MEIPNRVKQELSIAKVREVLNKVSPDQNKLQTDEILTPHVPIIV